MPRRISLFTTVALMLPAIASAATVTLTDEATFLVAVAFVTEESFAGLPATTTLNQTSIVAANFVINSPPGTNVLLAGSPGDFGPWMADVQAKIAATGRISGNIDMFDTSSGTPTAALLAGYGAVLTFTDAVYQDATLMGNRLADYVDAGGGVVQATFSWHTLLPLAGRWQSGGYSPLTYAGQALQTELFIGTRHLPWHPVLRDVNTFSGGPSSFHNTVVLAAGATTIADWTNGAPLVVEMGGFARKIIGLNFYPPSSDARGDFWRSSTDGDLLLANALAYVAAPCPCACDIDISTGVGVCDLIDFTTFAGLFAIGDLCACDFDTGTGIGVCDLIDFTTFAGQFAGGCP